MSNKLCYIILFVVLFLSCSKQNPDFDSRSQSLPAMVPRDSLIEVVPFLAGLPVKVMAGKPEVIFLAKNVQLLREPHFFEPTIIRIQRTGKDTLLQPKTIPVKGDRVFCKIPDMHLAEDAIIKDHNPQNFSYYNKLQGLKHSNVRCVMQDKQGYLWLGTNGGMSRFDGKNFVHYTKNNGLPNNTVNAIHQDNDGNIWSGTNGGGVSKFDGVYFSNYSKISDLAGNSVRCVINDHQGRIWIGTESGISILDNHLLTNITHREGLLNPGIRTILQDFQGKMWIGCDDGIITQIELIQNSGKTNYVFTHFKPKDQKQSADIRHICEDQKGNLWFATNGSGLFQYKEHRFYQYTQSEGLSSNRLSFLLDDQEGNLWIGYQGSGISKFNGEHLTHYSESDGLCGNSYNRSLKTETETGGLEPMVDWQNIMGICLHLSQRKPV